MQVGRAIVAPLVIAGGLAGVIGIAVPEATAGAGQVSSAQQTHPRVTPSVGHRRTTFELTFTLAQPPGRAGLEQTGYRAVVSAPRHVPASCTPEEPGEVTSGARGSTSRVALRPPVHGWCTGRYGVTVYLQRNSICGPPVEHASFVMCPVTAAEDSPSSTESLDTGEAHFTVR